MLVDLACIDFISSLAKMVLIFSSTQHAVLAQQCFSELGCTGDVVEAPGPSASDCCVGTEEGQSYGSPGDCTIPQCIGMHYTAIHFPLHLCTFL